MMGAKRLRRPAATTSADTCEAELEIVAGGRHSGWARCTMRTGHTSRRHCARFAVTTGDAREVLFDAGDAYDRDARTLYPRSSSPTSPATPRSSSSSSSSTTSAPPGAAQLRAPHRATRAVVEAEGQQLVRHLYAAFDEFNRAYFDGQLGEPLILVTFTSPRALGDHQRRDVHGLQSVIRVHPKTVRRGEAFSRDVLLHEMVHVWQGEVLGDLEEGYRGHGPKFAEKCTAIGRALELPEVGVKGRKGLPDCAGWPVNVRPAGFYGDEEAEAERRKRAPRPAAAEPDEATQDEARAPGGPRGPSARAAAAAVCFQAAEEAEAAGQPRRIIDALTRAAEYLRGGP
jgi:hypothetical protein